MSYDQKDVAARDVARLRASPVHERRNEDRDFLEAALKWLLSEIAASRLSSGAPVTLVLYDFRPMAAHPGADVDLLGGEGAQGGLYLCNGALSTCKVKAKKLNTTAAHQSELTKLELGANTSVTYDPATKKVHIRLRCLPGQTPIPVALSAQLEPTWATGGLTVVTSTIDNFHEVVINPTPLAHMLVDAAGATAEARAVYCDALYLYLRFGMGLAHDTGYRLTTHVTHLIVRQISTQRTAKITCSTMPDMAGDSAADAATVLDETHVSCISCDADILPSQECGVSPNSLRHRHVEAVEA